MHRHQRFRLGQRVADALESLILLSPASAVTSLSLEPPLVGISVARQAQLHELLREAGGFVTDWRGISQPICDRQVLAGNDSLHSRLHKTLAQALKAG